MGRVSEKGGLTLGSLKSFYTLSRAGRISRREFMQRAAALGYDVSKLEFPQQPKR